MDKLEKWSAALGQLALYALMGLGMWLMLSASSSYLELGEAHPFFLEKLPLAHPRWWLMALYVHVPSALLSLPACLVLLIGRVRSRWPRLHRWLGRATAALLLCAVVPSGMYLACFAQGGAITTLGFWLTGLIAFVAMLKSIQSARAGNMKAHRRFSTHVAAQLSVAVVSRFLLAGAEMVGLYSEWVYIAALWIPVIGCAVMAELVTRPRRSSISSRPARHAREQNKDLAMKSSLPFLVLMLCTSSALAEPPASPPNKTQNAATALVNKQLLVPLKKAESRRSRFSRAAPTPVQRRVRVLDTVALTDVRGKEFVRFAIDARRGWAEQGAWKKDSVVGCAYPNEEEVFVRDGDAYRPADSMLGKDEKERSGVCRVAAEARGPVHEQSPEGTVDNARPG